MGARQSVAQPARQDGVLSSGNVNNQGTNTTGHHSGSSHEASTSTGTSASAIGGGARPRLHLHSNSSPSSSNHRSSNRQSRSRSMATSSQMQADTAALIAALQQQRRRVNRLLTNAAMTTGSDLSSDSDDANDALMSTSTVRSLDRILRLNSNTDGETASSSSSNRVWLPPISFRCFDIKCPVCHKTIPFDDVECHLIMCLTRPKLIYNEEVLTEDRDECVICFDEMSQGDTIARLPCLCVYHKTCIDGWFKVKNVCPAHPGDD